MLILSGYLLCVVYVCLNACYNAKLVNFSEISAIIQMEILMTKRRPNSN